MTKETSPLMVRRRGPAIGRILFTACAAIAAFLSPQQISPARAFGGACPCCSAIHDPGHTSVSAGNGRTLDAIHLSLEVIRSDIASLQSAVGVEGSLQSVFTASFAELLGTWDDLDPINRVRDTLGRARITDAVPQRVIVSSGAIPQLTKLDPTLLLGKARETFFSTTLKPAKAVMDQVNLDRRLEVSNAALDAWVAATTIGASARLSADRAGQSLGASGTHGTTQRAQMQRILAVMEGQTAAIEDNNKVLAAMLRLLAAQAMVGDDTVDPEQRTVEAN